MSEMVPTYMNERWPIILPAHRAAREVNPFWEAQRLAATYSRISRQRTEGWMPDVEVGAPRVLDIGSEEGDFPCLYSMWGAEVFLVEPNPKAWPWIKRTFEANRQRPIGWFVGMLGAEASEGSAGNGWLWSHSNRFVWPGAVADAAPTPEHGFHHLAEHADVDDVTTVDELIRASDWRPDIITMDIEGGELHCLHGAERTLEVVRPELFISVHPQFMSDLYGHTEAELIAFLEAKDYRLQFLCEDHERHYHVMPREKPWPWSDPHG